MIFYILYWGKVTGIHIKIKNKIKQYCNSENDKNHGWKQTSDSIRRYYKLRKGLMILWSTIKLKNYETLLFELV